MVHVIMALFSVALIVWSTIKLTDVSLSSVSDLTQSWDEMTDRSGERSRTELTLISVDPNPTSTLVDVSLRNTGQTPLVDFAKWDLIVRYYKTTANQDMEAKWLPYTSPPPGAGEWSVNGIFKTASTWVAEIYDPNVFNPSEEMVIRINITPVIPPGTDNVVLIGTENGITVSAPFSR